MTAAQLSLQTTPEYYRIVYDERRGATRSPVREPFLRELAQHLWDDGAVIAGQDSADGCC